MRTKNILRPALILGLLTFPSTQVLSDTPAKSNFGPWQKAQVGDFMTITIPGKFKVTSVDLPEESRKMIDQMETYSLDNTNSDDYQCLVTNVIYNKGIMGDLDGAAKGAIDNMKSQPGIEDFRFGQKNIHRFNMDGVLMWGDFTSGGQKATFQSEIFIRRNVMWMVLVIDSSKGKYNAVSKYIFSSLAINTP